VTPAFRLLPSAVTPLLSGERVRLSPANKNPPNPGFPKRYQQSLTFSTAYSERSLYNPRVSAAVSDTPRSSLRRCQASFEAGHADANGAFVIQSAAESPTHCRESNGKLPREAPAARALAFRRRPGKNRPLGAVIFQAHRLANRGSRSAARPLSSNSRVARSSRVDQQARYCFPRPNTEGPASLIDMAIAVLYTNINKWCYRIAALFGQIDQCAPDEVQQKRTACTATRDLPPLLGQRRSMLKAVIVGWKMLKGRMVPAVWI